VLAHVSQCGRADSGGSAHLRDKRDHLSSIAVAGEPPVNGW
jgi:hypothetical protein